MKTNTPAKPLGKPMPSVYESWADVEKRLGKDAAEKCKQYAAIAFGKKAK